MADTKEKLVEILRRTRYEYRRYIGMKDMEKRMARTEEEFLAIDDSIVGEIPFCADHLIANGVTVTDNNVGGKWIPVTERLPDPETEVLILAERKTYSFKGKETKYRIVTTGMYEDGSKNTENSDWVWETDGFEYDEELDAYIIPEGWWEWKHYIDDECHNYAIDDVVTHWMPLPEPPKGE